MLRTDSHELAPTGLAHEEPKTVEKALAQIGGSIHKVRRAERLLQVDVAGTDGAAGRRCLPAPCAGCRECASAVHPGRLQAGAGGSAAGLPVRSQAAQWRGASASERTVSEPAAARLRKLAAANAGVPGIVAANSHETGMQT